MDLTPLFESIQDTPAGLAIRHSRVLIALIEIVHLLGLTLLAGTILMVDLRLLGLGMRRHPVSQIAAELAPWTVTGLAIMFLTGPLLFVSEAVKCYEHPSFAVKMGFLLLALITHFRIHQKVAIAEPSVGPVRAKLTAFLSLTAWTGVALSAKVLGA